MKDLDFDELDKAVNSLMAGVKSDDTPASDKEKTLTIGTSASSPVRSGSPTTPLPRPAAPPLASSSQPAPASRRGGRFMDVVHPSSDMKKPEPSMRSSREGVAINPRAGAETAPVSLDENHDTPAVSVEASVEAAKEKEVSPAPSVQPHHETGDWPDPLDMVPTKPEESKSSDADTPSVPANKSAVLEEAENESPWREATAKAKEVPAKVEPEPKLEVEAKPTDDSPLASPFLPDTKVEKRPLGANASTSAVDDLLVVDENAQLPANPKDVEPVLPAELHGDVMAIESDTTTKQTAGTEVPRPTDEDDSPWQKPNNEPQKTVVSSKSEGPTPAEIKREEPKITGPTSIAQQYHEEPSTGDQKNGAIYDTDTYHQPLSHPAKKKSGWMWIVWILLIVVIGAGAGAAAYMRGLV